ncbi:MAG: TetR/AcrR family transcriptional regulator [Gammaproteobacteria bacterium]|nr:TetR/AcrR family transcriptional regulator [Gammaproteobacteria bacterium]
MATQERIDLRKRKLQNQRQPVQQRSRQRREEILLATATLLEQVGFDGLTTTLVAKEMGISVGSLYHYFPHKQAILHAMGEHWLQEYSAALERMRTADLEHLELSQFAELAVAELLEVYKHQRGMLPLVQAMYAVPELRDLDAQHDDLVIREMAAMFARIGLSSGKTERERLARLWLEMTHSMLLSIVEQAGGRASKSRADLVNLCQALLVNYI